MTVPYTFATTPAGNNIPLSRLDDNFNALGNSTNASFLQSGTSAVERTVQAKLSETVSVKDFGAVGDGVTDDTAAIQAALDSLSAGGFLYFPAGTFKITSTLSSSANNLSLVGAGVGATTLLKEFSTNNLFTLSGAKLNIRGFLVDTTLVHTAGIVFAFTTTSGNIWMDNILTDKCYNIVDFTQSTQTFITNCIFNNFVNDGVRYRSLCGGQNYLNNVRMGLNATTNNGAGLYIEGGDTYHVSNVDVTSAASPIRLEPPANAVLVNLFFSNVTGDGVNRTSGNSGWTINGTASGAVLRRIRLTNCWAGVNYLDGFRIQGADDVALYNCISITNQRAGIYLAASPTPTNVKIVGCTVTGNSLNNTNVYSGIEIDDYTSDFSIKDCVIKPIAGMSNTQKYGVEVKGTNHDRYYICGNDVTGNATANINDAGVGPSKYVSENLGYTNQSSGFGSITAATSATVSHGLSITPAQADILVTPTNDPGSGVRWWVSATTATTFTLSTNATATFGFGWRIRTGGA